MSTPTPTNALLINPATHTDLLPSHGNRIGDLWVVGNTPWVWIWAPGAAHAGWVDP